MPAGRYRGVCASPLRSGRLDPPDIVLVYGNPAQIVLIVNGLQWRRYRRYDMTVTGETACSDSWGRALATGETSISIPCYAERRYGGVADDEMLIAMPPDELARRRGGPGGAVADRPALPDPALRRAYGPGARHGPQLPAGEGGADGLTGRRPGP